MSERLQKIMAKAGLGSRRACEEMIAEGRVRVNGEIATLGRKVEPTTDKITVDGAALEPAEKPVYIALYKPRNVVSSVADEVGRTTVRDLIPEARRLYPVGRLDWDSEGLVLMTNDGDLTNRLTHPRYGHEKEYRVLVARRPDSAQIQTWQRGVVLEDSYRTAPSKVFIESGAGKGTWLRITMGEGKKRQIREVGSMLGLPVVRIVRVRIGTLRLGTMKPGDWRYLSDREIAELKGEKVPVQSKPSSRRAAPGRGKKRPAPTRTATRKPTAAKAKRPPRLTLKAR
jgi:23S rRNA pseudouridine2605 synthase